MFGFKIIATAVLLGVLVNGEVQNVTALSKNDNPNPLTRPDDYINANRRVYDNNIKDYDQQMDNFRKSFTGRVDTINLQLDMLLDAIVQCEERLNPLELLSDFSKDCVRKYRSSIPTIANTKSSVGSCVTAANNMLNSMLSSPLNTRNVLYNYYIGTYDKGITNCDNKFKDLPMNYTLCVTSLTTSANSYTISSQKTFAIQMDTAECSANANIKKALDCSFNVQNRTLSLIAEANALIDKCLLGQSECKPCSGGYSCPDVYYVKRHEIDYKNSTMPNPFYGRDNNSSCLLLEIYDYNRIY